MGRCRSILWSGLLEIIKDFLMKIIKIILFTLIACSCDRFDLKIVNNPKYSIGLVSNYRPGGRGGASVVFLYSANKSSLSNSYFNGDHHWNVPSGGIHIGYKFMVQYDSLDPSTARMLFSYPVNDSVDFKKYIVLFKTSPPGYPDP